MNTGTSVSVVVCVRNTVELLKKNLGQIKKALPAVELIVVDGNSTDGSQEVARQHADKVVSDEGKGLAYARQLGITSASRPFVAFVGPDNLVEGSLIAAMQSALEKEEMLAGVAPQTNVVNATSYWEKTTRAFFKHFINKPGYVRVIGTPCMWKRDVLLKIPYDPAIRAAADDTDVALRLGEAGYRLAIIDAFAEENMQLDKKTFLARWAWYGKGDAELYAKHKTHWSLPRRIRSLLHPLYTYALKGAFTLLLRGEPQYIPGMWMAVFARYTGWMRHARTLRNIA